MELETMTAIEPTTRRWTREEYHRMAELGLFLNQRVELVDGEVLEMNAQGPPHVTSVQLVSNALQKMFGPGFWVRMQAPLNLGESSEPEPDIAVVPGAPRDYADHPTTALLVVEISDATLRYDRRHKGSLYARCGIRDYWIVNLVDGVLEVYRDSASDASAPFGWSYRNTQTLFADDRVSPLHRPDQYVSIADVLP